MEPDQIRILNILEEISEQTHTSQREIARKLNISLGLVNAFVRRLIKKGYFKATTLPKNRISYILTPKGAAEKTRLTYEYLQYSLGFYKVTKQKILSTLQDIIEAGHGKVVVYGSGELAEISALLIKQSNLEIVAVVDEKEPGSKFMERKLCGIEAVASLEYDKILVTELQSGQSIGGIADALNVPREKIVTIQ